MDDVTARMYVVNRLIDIKIREQTHLRYGSIPSEFPNNCAIEEVGICAVRTELRRPVS